jgi:CheY-like chemotaxis protein
MIFVVEDDAHVREAMREVIEDEGFAVFEAENGKVALDQLRRGPRPSLVLLDLMMPVMNGFEFLEQRKQDPAFAVIPVVIVSAAERSDVEETTRRNGAAGFLLKPVQLVVLQAVLHKHAIA